MRSVSPFRRKPQTRSITRSGLWLWERQRCAFSKQQTRNNKLVSRQVEPQSGETDLFIYPPFTFRVVDALLTNFHLPRSTLLMLVSAFAGREFILRAYEEAVRERYRFYSYGDCMLIL